MNKIKLLLLMAVLFLFGLSTSVNAFTLGDDAYQSLEGKTFTSIDPDKTINQSFVNVTGDPDPTFHGYLGGDTLGSWSGYYLGTFGDTDRDTFIKQTVEYYLDTVLDSYMISKVDYQGLDDENNPILVYTGTPQITIGNFNPDEDGDWTSGSWTIEDPFALGFYTVKGATNWALYFVPEPYKSSGFWTTAHLEKGSGDFFPQISHLSALSTKTTPVPEPGMVILLGIGLIGLAFYSRKRLFNQ